MEQLTNLKLDGKLSKNDLQNLLKEFEGSMNNKKKKGGLTPQEKNALINQLTSSQNLNDTPKVINQNMTEDEKKAHREELRQKLNNKTNMMRNNRSNKIIQTKICEDKINKVTQNINISGLAPQEENKQEEIRQDKNKQEEKEDLDDFIN